MIKYASFMISLQNGNHGSTDLTDFFYWFREFLPENLEPQLRTRILQHQTWLAGKSPSWRILMVKSSWNQRFPCHLWFPVVSMNPISLYTILYWLYIAHMSTYVFIYIYAPYYIPNTISHHLPAEAPGQAPPSVFPRPVQQEGTPPVWSCRCHGSVASSGRPGRQARHQKSSENWSCISIYIYTDIDIDIDI